MVLGPVRATALQPTMKSATTGITQPFLGIFQKPLRCMRLLYRFSFWLWLQSGPNGFSHLGLCSFWVEYHILSTWSTSYSSSGWNKTLITCSKAMILTQTRQFSTVSSSTPQFWSWFHGFSKCLSIHLPRISHTKLTSNTVFTDHQHRKRRMRKPANWRIRTTKSTTVAGDAQSVSGQFMHSYYGSFLCGPQPKSIQSTIHVDTLIIPMKYKRETIGREITAMAKTWVKGGRS